MTPVYNDKKSISIFNTKTGTRFTLVLSFLSIIMNILIIVKSFTGTIQPISFEIQETPVIETFLEGE